MNCEEIESVNDYMSKKGTPPQELITSEFHSQFCKLRPKGIKIDTIILHSIHNLHPELGERFSAKACKSVLDKFEVSAHYLIDREGTVCRMVPESKAARHAGVSSMPDKRESVNDSSIGIELIGDEESQFTDRQYQELTNLCVTICGRYDIRYILGHNHIAPERKTDPWNFDWDRFTIDLKKLISNCNINIGLK